MKSIFVKSNGNYGETYAKACEIADIIPRELFRGITSHYEYDDATKKLYEHFDINYVEPGEIEKDLILTPELKAWFKALEDEDNRIINYKR